MAKFILIPVIVLTIGLLLFLVNRSFNRELNAGSERVTSQKEEVSRQKELREKAEEEKRAKEFDERLKKSINSTDNSSYSSNPSKEVEGEGEGLISHDADAQGNGSETTRECNSLYTMYQACYKRALSSWQRVEYNGCGLDAVSAMNFVKEEALLQGYELDDYRARQYGRICYWGCTDGDQRQPAKSKDVVCN